MSYFTETLDYVLEITRGDIQSKYLERGDACINLGELNPLSNNILYIIGMSGSGKTTLGVDLAKELDCERVELDYICSYYMTRTKDRHNGQSTVYNKLKGDCSLASQFFLDKDRNEKYNFKSWGDAIPVVDEFMKWFVPQIENNGKIYIINGGQLSAIYDAEYFYTRPLIIKDIDVIKTLYRRILRETDFDHGLQKLIETFLKNIKMITNINYHNANKELKSFRKVVKKNSISCE